MNKEALFIYEEDGFCELIWTYKDLLKLQRENNQLKEQLHKCSIDIQELYEQDIECPSSCHRFKELRSWLEESKRIAVAQEHRGSINAINLVLDKLNELEGIKDEKV